MDVDITDIPASIRAFVNASVRLVWRGESYRKWVEKQYAKRLDKAAGVVRDYAQARLSLPYPPASLPGEYPHARTGELRESIVVEPNYNRLTVSIGTSLPYGLWLEYGITGGRVIRASPGKMLSWVDDTGQRHFAQSVRQGPIRARPWARPSVTNTVPQTRAILAAPLPEFV